MRVLVIDDSRAMRFLLRRMMTELGFEVDEAAHGVQALEVLQGGERPDLMMVDWNMPEMDGYEFVKAVRADQQYDDVPLMMVTTETEMAQVMRALDAGADEYVMKPFTREVIEEKVELLGLTGA